MSDSGSFSSLLALVDNHLSKISKQEKSEGSTHNLSNSLKIPKLTNENGAQSDEKLAFSLGERIGIPSFSFNSTLGTDYTSGHIKDVLAQQVSNMFKAKELKRQQEKQKLTEETGRLKLEEDNCINLAEAIQTPYKSDKLQETLSSANSIESVFESMFSDIKEEMPMKSSETFLPCKTDMAYILKQNIRRGKCSNFGRVLTARLRPTAAPYFKENVNSSVVQFDFNVPSPCDLIKEKRRKPTTYNTYDFNILDMI